MEPKRIGWWLGLVIALGLTYWLTRPSSPSSTPLNVELPTGAEATEQVESMEVVTTTLQSQSPYQPPMNPVAAKLNAPEFTAEDDVANVHQLLDQMFGVWKGQRRPMSLNVEFTRALLGANPVRMPFVPVDHPAIIDGELTDRWGNPYVFHLLSLDRIEVRSAGEDERLYTMDDVLYSPWRNPPEPVMP
ncbi:hypothetical protein [Cerasicoccus frondis]|uniref:hypothetical protein n=1 Tax=Cerasicoccus frondis TaxID=490090 RepID=UPI0028527AAC|nr:hypothetical protein [Cerasicoccus frondis]